MKWLNAGQAPKTGRRIPQERRHRNGIKQNPSLQLDVPPRTTPFHSVAQAVGDQLGG